MPPRLPWTCRRGIATAHRWGLAIELGRSSGGPWRLLLNGVEVGLCGTRAAAMRAGERLVAGGVARDLYPALGPWKE